VALPYVFGGISKLGGDWLHGQPMQIWMSHMHTVREFVPAFGELWLAVLFSWGGLLLDLAIVPLLLWRRTRTIAFAGAVLFHLLNAVMFRIGVFPWLMIAATTLFLPPDWPRRAWEAIRGSSLGSRRAKLPQSRRSAENYATAASPSNVSALALAFAAIFIGLQVLLPLRHWAIPGNVDWTEEGSLFSWRMMLNDKPAAVRFVAVDAASGRTTPINPRRFLIQHQIERMSRDPEMLREFAAFLKRGLAAAGTPAEIHVLAIVSLNGRRPQLLLDPEIDLGGQQRTWRTAPWIVPLNEPRRWPAWHEPPSHWEQYSKPETLAVQ
jgi:vitamin K-dependent gamma-carboxylase